MPAQTCRIRIGRRLAQKDDDAAVHARLGDMDVRLRHGSLQPAERFRIEDFIRIFVDRGGEHPAGSRGHRGRLLVAGQQRGKLFGFGDCG